MSNNNTSSVPSKNSPLMFFLECTHYDFWHYRHFIRTPESPEQLLSVLGAINSYACNCAEAPEGIKDLLKDIRQKIVPLIMHNYTFSEFCQDLDKMVEALNNAILAENPDWKADYAG